MKTMHLVLIGGGIAAAVYFVAKSKSAPAQESTLGSVASITNGVSSIVKSIFGGGAGTTPTDGSLSGSGTSGGSTTTPGASSTGDLVASLANYNSGGAGGLATQAWSSNGDAAFSDGLGVARISGRVQQPSRATTRAQRVQVGDFAQSSYALRSYR